ncbi:hypothetical protein [Teichococcus aestuarii]|uniref:hypothetical protein n=1 Tax=Teichococcus aestuarii TaxID=568898 RepID=UPI0036213400
MIEATQGVKKQVSGPDILTKSQPAAEHEEREAAVHASGSSEPQLAERQKQITASSPAFDVRLDGETMRLYSELRDPATDRLIMRLPTGYLPAAEDAEAKTFAMEA